MFNRHLIIWAVLASLIPTVALAGFPKALAPLNVSERDFVQAIDRFLQSPAADALSVQDAFYLVGVCRSFNPPALSNKTQYSRNLDSWTKAIRKARALAWGKATASPRSAMTAIAANRNTAIPNLDESARKMREMRNKPPVLASLYIEEWAPKCTANEAREWLNLLDLEQAIKRTRREKPFVHRPQPPALNNDLTKDLPPSLAKALADFSKIAAPCFAAYQSHPPLPERIKGSVHPDWKMTSTALVGGAGRAAAIHADLMRNSVAWCGMISGPEIPPLIELPVLTRLLADERWTEAAGYALLMDARSNSKEGTERINQLRADILDLLAPEWQSAVLGARVLAAILSEANEPFHRVPGDTPGWLPSIITDSILDSYLDLQKWQDKKMGFHSGGITELLDLNQDSQTGEVTKRLPRRQPLSAESYRKVARYFCGMLNVGERVDEARRSVNILACVDTPESRERLRAYHLHPSPTIANIAARALRSFGESAADCPLEQPLPIRIALDGKPVANRDVYWERRGWHSRGSEYGMNHGYGKTDADGVVRVSRDFFYGKPSFGESTAFVTSLTAPWNGRRQSSDGNGVNLAFSIAWPPKLDAQLDLSAMASEATLVLVAPQGEHLPADVDVRLLLSRSPDGKVSTVPRSESPLICKGPTIALHALQSGTWELGIRAPGMLGWKDIVTLEPGKPTVEIHLQPGTEVRVALPSSLLAAGASPIQALELFRDENRVESEWNLESEELTRTYPLPPGKYRMRLRSSEEIYKRSGLLRASILKTPAGEKTFEITDKTGPAHDLGSFK